MADELDDMLARMIIRKAPDVKPEEAADIAASFRALLRADRAVVVEYLCKQLELRYCEFTADILRKLAEKYND